jgi:6-phosphogluconolactonase
VTPDKEIPVKHRALWTLALAALLPALALPQAGAAAPPAHAGAAGAVFVGTNHNNTLDPDEPANQVAMYVRDAAGALELKGYYDTGGQGSGPGQRFAGDGLGSGGSVTLSEDRRFLLVTNAGSDSVTVFRVHRDRLERTDVEPTGDGSPGQRFPNSVTQRGDLVYVLNAADRGSITGFRLSRDGELFPLAGSRRSLDANQQRFAPDALYNPAQVSFTPDGSQLVVTIKDGPSAADVPGAEPTGPGRVLVWSVGAGGRLAADYTRTDFANRGPFGFSFDRHGNLLVALFVGGPVDPAAGGPTGAAGSFRINDDGTLTAISERVPDSQIDTCWLVNNGRYAFGANYTSGTVSSFRLGNDGSLELLRPVAGTTDHPGNLQGTTPLDMAVSGDGRFLYLVEPGAGKVGAWRIRSSGALTKVGEFAGLPQTPDGDHAPADFGTLGSPAGIAAT